MPFELEAAEQVIEGAVLHHLDDEVLDLVEVGRVRRR
jgi:hypothetical protein